MEFSYGDPKTEAAVGRWNEAGQQPHALDEPGHCQRRAEMSAEDKLNAFAGWLWARSNGACTVLDTQGPDSPPSRQANRLIGARVGACAFCTV
jgi:hypothetical protein